MATRDYPRLSIEDFGHHLIKSGDLDPIYIALASLRGGKWSTYQTDRWLVAYFCFYHAGFACYASRFEQGDDFWAVMMTAARNETDCPAFGPWPRGSERRHFRAANAIAGIEGLRKRYGDGPGAFLRYCATGNPDKHCSSQPIPFMDVSKRVREHAQFGPWMAFKVADILERVLAYPINFSEAEVFMFDDPRKAALKLFRSRAGLPEEAKLKDEGDAIRKVCAYLGDHFKAYQAPPYKAWDGIELPNRRPIGLQEVETILCKWKSHMNGHYPINKDTVEIAEGLSRWADLGGAGGDAARRFLEALPKPMAYGEAQ